MTKRLPLTLFFIAQVFLLFGQQFKVVGYLPYYRFDISDKINFAKITHLNLAFVNPDTLGNLSIAGRDPAPVVAMALMKNPDLKIFASLGGGAIKEEWQKAYDKYLRPENRSEFVHLLTEYVIVNDIDGLDVDLEWQHVNEFYSPFVLELRDSLHDRGKVITAALPGIHRYADLSQDALDAYDFINLMAYDMTGPWNPDNPGPHSDYQFAVESIDFWKGQGVPGDKLTLGVPFYGWDFTNQNDVKAFAYGSIVAEDTLLAYVDQDGQRYYNGIRTIQEKTLLAIEETGGIMIWELGQDAFDAYAEYSLLAAIDFVVQHGELPIITGLREPFLTQGVKVFPNPFHEKITIVAHENQAFFRARLTDMQGRALWSSEGYFHENETVFDTPGVPAGAYVLQVEVDGKVYRKVLIHN